MLLALFLQNDLEMAIAHLLTDRDPDCLEAMHQAEIEMDKISYRVQSVRNRNWAAFITHSHNSVCTNDKLNLFIAFDTVVCIQLVTHSFIEEDKIDKEREEEEMQWLKDEEEEEFTRQQDGRRSTGSSRASPGTPRAATKKTLAGGLVLLSCDV